MEVTEKPKKIMAIAIIMPQVGQDIETARINEWHVRTGDQVNSGDIIATVESDKASFEVESHAGGFVIQLLYQEGEEAPVFKPIAFLGEKNERYEKVDINEQPSSESQKKQEVNLPDIPLPSISAERMFISPSAKRKARELNIPLENLKQLSSGYRIKKKDVIAFGKNGFNSIKITPLARKLGDEAGVNPDIIAGSGYNQRVMARDVLGQLGMPKSKNLEPTEGDRIIVFGKTRKRIGERLSFSKHTIPHYYLFADVDVTQAEQIRQDNLKKTGVKISMNDIVIKASAEALVMFPEMNAWVDENKMIIKPEINIGVATATDEGLLVPVIPQANTLNLNGINEISKKNAADARKGIVQLKYKGTITVTNLGMYGVSRFLPIINPPECAILSLGAVEEKVISRNGKPTIASMLTLGLACDHRAVDGAKAAMFLSKIKELIEKT